MATITITPGWAGPASAVGTNPIVVQVAGVGPPGAAGTSGVAPSGTGIVTVTSGTLNTPAALTGDVTTTAGGLATTLATVNSNVGTFTNASVTVNAKGLVTAASSGAAGGITIGDTVTSGTSGRVLYVGAGPVLAQDAGLTYDPATDTLTTGTIQSIAAGDLNLYASAVNVKTGAGDYTNLRAMRLFLSPNNGSTFPVGIWSDTPSVELGSAVKICWSSGTDSLGGKDTAATRAAAKVLGLTDGSTAGATLSSVPLTPSQITSNQNNYAPGVARYYRLSTDASRDITGLSCSQVSGQECEIWNVGSFAIVLKHQDANSTAANRFLIDTGTDLTVLPNSRVELRYDSTQSRWVVASPGGLAIGSSVTSGTSGRVLYVGAGPVLAQDAGLTYDPATDTLTAGPVTAVGTVTVRQSGGVAGTDEVQISHDGTYGTVRSYDGRLCLRPSNGIGFNVDNDGSSRTRFTGDSGSVLLFDNATIVQVGGAGSGNGPAFYTANMRMGSGGVVLWSDAASPTSGSDRAGVTSSAAKVVGLTDGSTGGATLSSVPLTPAQITANQNNYAPGVARYYRLSTDASRDITGLSCSQVSGQECEIWNVDANSIVLKHQDANSTAANRFICTGAADITLAQDEVCLLRYDSVSSRWRVRKI